MLNWWRWRVDAKVERGLKEQWNLKSKCLILNWIRWILSVGLEGLRNCDPAILLLSIYPKECKPGHHRATSHPCLFAALFTVAKLWKEPRCYTTDEWIKEMWYMYTMEYYSSIHPFIHPLSNCLLSTYFMPGIVLMQQIPL
jgi:hypothetical protein